VTPVTRGGSGQSHAVRKGNCVPVMSDRTGGADLTAENSRTALSVRSAEAGNSEEPCAVIPHAGVCEGAVG